MILCIVTVQLVFCVVRDQSEILRCAFADYNDFFCAVIITRLLQIIFVNCVAFL